MADYSPSVDDLALYFANNQGGVSSCWIKHSTYTSTLLKPVPSAWQMADLLESEVPGSGGGVFYVVNLSRLLGPGVPAAPPNNPPPPPPAAPSQPRASDLVIIPYDDPNNAYLVPRTVYSDPAQCPPLVENPGSSDIIVAALNVGVVLANIPKATPLAGWGCYLLSLISLKSGAVAGVDDLREDKGSYFSALPSTGKSSG